MDEFIQNPAAQAGVFPFLVSLVLACALARTRLLGLPVIAGFLVLAAFAIGFSFESLTATKKLVLIGLTSGMAVLALEWRPGAAGGGPRAALLAALGVACVWMLWRLLAQREPAFGVIAALLAVLYVGCLAESTLRAGVHPVAGAAIGLMLGLGTGVLAVLGASALLGLVAISVGASSGAVLLVQMVRGQSAPTGSTIGLPAVIIAGLAGLLSVLSGSLPWFCLIPLLATPWASRLGYRDSRPVWQSAVVSSLACLVPVVAAILLAWLTTGSAPS